MTVATAVSRQSPAAAAAGVRPGHASVVVGAGVITRRCLPPSVAAWVLLPSSSAHFRWILCNIFDLWSISWTLVIDVNL
jgi:hypothetical protein